MNTKKLGLTLIILLALQIIPVSGASSDISVTETSEYFEQTQGNKLRFYKDTNYDQLLRPDGSTLVESQTWSVEYLDGKTWTPLNDAATIENHDTTITRRYTNYNVMYRSGDGFGTKMDVEIQAPITCEYRIVWRVDGIKPNKITSGENYVKYSSSSEWVIIDWSDAYNQYGEISELTFTDTGLEVTFYVGTIKAGEKLTLDPTIAESYTDISTTLIVYATHPSTNASRSAVGQSFNASTTFNLNNVTFKLTKVGTPVGIAHAVLYAHNNTLGINSTPMGPALATSDNFQISQVGAVAADYNFTFTGSNQYQCVNNTAYVIVFQIDSATIIGPPNYIRIAQEHTAPTHPGNAMSYFSSNWTPSARDTYFIIYDVEKWNAIGNEINEVFNLYGIVDYMVQITEYIDGLSSEFTNSLTRLVALMVQQFRVINEVYTFFTYWFTAMVGLVLDFSNYWQSVVDNTYAIGNGLGNIWDIISYDAWAPVVPLALFLWYVTTFAERSERSGGEVQLFVNDISTAINLVSYFTGIFMFVANTIIDRVYGLFDAVT